MAKLASLVVDLQLQSAELRKGLDEANRKLDEFAKGAESAGNIVAGAFALDTLKDGVMRLAAFVKGGADAADAMGDMAAAVGVPVEQLSKLGYAAQFSGSSTEAVGKALSKTADLMGKSLISTSEQAAMFKALGISATDADGKLRATQDVFADIAQRFSETADGPAKTALSIKLFGDEGAKLIPMLNNGKAGLAAFGAEAEHVGAVVTQKGAAAAGDFNDALNRLHMASQGLALRVAQDLAPSMSSLADSMVAGVNGSSAMKGTAEALAGTLRGLASIGVVVGATFQALGEDLAGIAAGVTNLVKGDFRAANESSIAAGEALRSTYANMKARLAAIWDAPAIGPGAAMAKDAEQAKPSADKYVSAIDKFKTATQDATSALKAQLEVMRKLHEIERDMAKRRADIAGDSPTKGFSDIEDAIQKLEAYRKLEARLRENARLLEEKAGHATKTGDKNALLNRASAETEKADITQAAGDRADAAVSAFKERAKAAADSAGKLMEEAAAARSALEKKLQDIDKEVAKKREEAVAQSPTNGFANFEEALNALSNEMREAAIKRAAAAEAERDAAQAASQISALVADGKEIPEALSAHYAALLADARESTLAAEAHEKLAEKADAASDAFKELHLAAQRVPGELLGMLKPGGPATSAVVQVVETGAAAGPVGAVVGGLTGLLSQSETFKHALEQLETIFQALADSVGVLLEPLMPLLEVFGLIAQGFGALFEVISPIVEFVARPLFEVFKGFGMVVLGLIKFIGDIINGIAKAFGGKGFDMSGVDGALDRLSHATYDNARAEEHATKVTRDMTESVSNVPAWWKANLARFNAAEPGRTGGGAGGGGTSITDNSTTTINLNGAEVGPDELAEMLDNQRRRRRNSRYDTEMP